MRPVLIVTHLEDRSSGLVRGVLEAEGCSVACVDGLAREALPALAEVSAIVSFGGRQSAVDVSGDAFLAAEVELMRGALAEAVPVFGLCLGAQLLAVAAGGVVRPYGRMLAEWRALSLTHAAASDPLFGAFPDGVAALKWHEDVITAPAAAADAVVLAVADSPGAALFRVGECAWASQPHFEVTPSLLLDGWLADAGAPEEIAGAGHSYEEFRAESAALLPAQMAAARPLFARFAALVRERAAAHARGVTSSSWP